MTKVRYFNDGGGKTVELTGVYGEGKARVGRPVDFVPVWDAVAGKWNRGEVAVTRAVFLKANPSRHECDSRCLNATGRTMNCECSCGGRNHGRGSFVCVGEAA